MKYWIFQNNQVLGPYGMDDLSRVSTFSPESLVCPEGRHGTSMGDWQRAGMVPDLSVALVRATSSPTQTATQIPPQTAAQLLPQQASPLPVASLPPEPALKDMAALENLQGKVSTLEKVVMQLQEGLRAKDGELSAVRAELSSKSSEANAIRSEAAERQREAIERQREAVERQREAETLKRQLAGVEDRLSSLRLLSETLDKAVEEEKRVEQDVEKQGETISALTHEIENLSRQITERHGAAPVLMMEAQPIPAPVHAEPQEIIFAAAPEPIAAPEPAVAPEPIAAPEPTVAPEPIAVPEYQAAAVSAPEQAAPFETRVHEFPAFEPGAEEATYSPPAPAPASVSDISSFGADTIAPEPAPAKDKKKLILGVVLGVGALAVLGVLARHFLSSPKPETPVAVLEPATEATPEPAPAPALDPRQAAVDFAKEWPLPNGKTLGRALQELAPTIGNLSPWMAETLPGGPVQVNYFARGAAAGAPTIAYEFAVDLEGKTLVGRNAAAKSVLAGKAAAPPAPPKAKTIKVKAKKIAVPAIKAAAKAAPRAASKAASAGALDSMLGEPGADEQALDEASPEEKPSERKPSSPPASQRGGAKAKSGKPAADESLLDDLLKE